MASPSNTLGQTKKRPPNGGRFLSLFSAAISAASGRRGGARRAVPDQDHGQQQARTGSSGTATTPDYAAKIGHRPGRAGGQPTKSTRLFLLSCRQFAHGGRQAHLTTKLVALNYGQRACGTGEKRCSGRNN